MNPSEEERRESARKAAIARWEKERKEGAAQSEQGSLFPLRI